MSKYLALTHHLGTRSASSWTASFREIETILGFSLPASARSYPAWWSNQTDGGHSQSSAWQSIGWRTCDLDLGSQKVTFVRSQENRVGQTPEAAPQLCPTDGPAPPRAPVHHIGALNLSEAKAGLAQHFGVPAENIEITIRA
jgi:hypothetical protein